MTNDGGGGAGGGRGPGKGRGGRAGGGGGRGRGGGRGGGGGGSRPRSNSGGGPHHPQQQQQQRRRRPRSASHPSPSSSPSPSSPSSPPSQPLSTSSSSSRDASHLLNFRTAGPTPSSSSSSQKTRGGGDKKKKKRRETPDQRRKRLQSERDERRHRQNLDSAFYLKSSSVHAFVLTETANDDGKPSGGRQPQPSQQQQQQPHDPDAVVKWDDVRTVRWLVSAHHGKGGGGGDDDSTTRCPVCLDSHAAPRIVPCGHAFCYSCLLRHLYRDDRSSAAATATAAGAPHSQRTSSAAAAPKKCPCCAKPIDPTNDLRPVEFVTVVPPLVNHTMTFRKLHRIKHRPAPYVPTSDAKPRTSTLHPWPSASQEDVDGLYSRYQRFDVGTYRNHLVRDLSELRARAIELGGGGGGGEEELFFIRMAGESVKSELRSIEASCPSSPAVDSVAASGEEGTSDNATAAKEQEVEGSRQSRQQSVNDYEAVPEEAHGKADKKKRSTSQQLSLLHPNGGSRYLDSEHETQFYQAADGQCCFLSGFNVACLSAEFSVTVPPPPPPSDGNDDAAAAADVDRSAPPVPSLVPSPVPQGSVEAKGGGDGAATQADDDDDGAIRGKAEEAAAAGSISEGGSLLTHTDERANNNDVGDDDNANNNDDGQRAAAAAALRQRRRRPLPDTIEGRIVDVEIVHLTPEVRKRRPFLSHLPLYADVTFVELDLNRILSDDVKIQFKNEFDRRKKERKRRKDAEKRADRVARAKEEERIDELRKRIQRIDPNDEFFRTASGSFDEEDGDVVVGEDFGPGLGDVDGGVGGGDGTRIGAGDDASKTTAAPPVVRPRRRSPPRDAVFSFNRVCATGGVWPGLGEGSATASTSTSSSPPTGGGVWGSAGRGEVGGVGGRGGGGGGPPVQWGRNDRNSEGPIPGPSMAHVDATKLTPLSPPSPSQLGKKKGKGKKVLLFSTGGQRGAGY